MDKITVLFSLEYLVRFLIIVAGSYTIALIRKYQLEKWVKVAVVAAEQMFEVGLITTPKKEYVINFIKDKFKFSISESELDALIEAAVYELNMLKELNKKDK